LPGCCARTATGHAAARPEQRDEVAAFHSINSSARSKTFGNFQSQRPGGGEVNNGSNLLGCSTECRQLRAAQNLIDKVRHAGTCS
jgi:hypothetical protein